MCRNLTSAEKQALHVEEASMGSCLVAVARLQHFGDTVQRPKLDTSENMFVGRIGVDGRFTYVDPRYVRAAAFSRPCSVWCALLC